MLVAISGSQGQGKTTILDTLQEVHGIEVVEQKTSRSILRDWGYTLDEVNKYAPLTKSFQEEIIKRHSSYMSQLCESDELYMCERSFADIFTYTMFAMGSYNEYNNFLDNYYQTCKILQEQYSAVIYISGREGYVPEEDGVRSVNRHFAESVDVLNAHYTREMTPSKNLISINNSNHNERITLITTELEIRGLL